MGTQSRIAQWGTSLAIRIPKPLAEEWGVHAGSAIEMTTDGEHLMLTKRVYDLDEILSRVTTDNLHYEWDTGSAQGKEIL